MSSVLFLAAICGFVAIVYWAFRNDTMKLDEDGSGLLAMKPDTGEAPKTLPKWKKAPSAEEHRPAKWRHDSPAKPHWRRALLYGKSR